MKRLHPLDAQTKAGKKIAQRLFSIAERIDALLNGSLGDELDLHHITQLQVLKEAIAEMSLSYDRDILKKRKERGGEI